MDIRRRMINIFPPPTADNVFVIDSITFEECSVFGTLFGYYSITGNLNVIESLGTFIIENGNIISSSTTHTAYEIDPSQIELYLYDYKISINRLKYYTYTNASPILEIYSPHGILPKNMVYINSSGYIMRNAGMDGEWTFDHIPTTSVEAILFVEFAKQYGVDAIKIDGYSLIWYEEDKIIDIILQNTSMGRIYGAGNGQFSGEIYRTDIN